MSFSYKGLKNDRQWKATTGMSEKDFDLLCNAFEKAYELKHGLSLEQAAVNLAQEFALCTIRIVCSLFYFNSKTV